MVAVIMYPPFESFLLVKFPTDYLNCNSACYSNLSPSSHNCHSLNLYNICFNPVCVACLQIGGGYLHMLGTYW